MNSHTPPVTVSLLNKLADTLVEKSWCVIPNFLSERLISELRADALSIFDAGGFREARIGRGNDLKTEKRIRSDEICWFEPEALSEPQQRLWNILEQVRVGLNERLFLGLNDFEAHFARYEPGRAYGKHRDRFNSDDARTISVVLYLNDDWAELDGGELKLYPEGAAEVSVTPRGGTLVCFLSEGLAHEVLPSPTRTRLSVAAWFRKQKSPLR